MKGILDSSGKTGRQIIGVSLKGMLDPSGRKLSHWRICEGRAGPQWEKVKSLGYP